MITTKEQNQHEIAGGLLVNDSWLRWDGAQIQLTVTKVPKGIVQRMYIDGAMCQEVFSRRPYRLGQHCDGTIDTCVHALFILWCQVNAFDPEHVYATAYPEEPRSDYSAAAQRRVLSQANAEGIVVPQNWDEKSFMSLLDSLTQINNHLLTEVVENLDNELPIANT